MKRQKGRKNRQQTTSFTLRNVRLVNEADMPSVDSLLKTFNSAARCAFKRFQSINLRGAMKGREPNKRNPLPPRFLDYAIEGGRALKYECPAGMSEEMWREMRKASYDRARARGMRNANRFWQLDKDLGSPIQGTMKAVSEWVERNNLPHLDSTLVHEAVMSGYRTHMSFEGKKARWLTAKDAPSFGDMVGRSRKDITGEEFQLTRNASITATGRRGRHGNPKFRFDLDKMEMTFTSSRRRIAFTFKGTRLSRKGLAHLSRILDGMESGKTPVTVTLKKTPNGIFTVNLAYSPKDLPKASNARPKRNTGARAAIYATDEVVHHAIVDRDGKVLLSRTYVVDDVSGARRSRPQIECLKWRGHMSLAHKLEARAARKTSTAARQILSRIFNENRAFGVGEVVVESPRARCRRNFNCSLLEFNRDKILHGNAKPCFMPASSFSNMVKSGCARNGMKFTKVNRAFTQAQAIFSSSSMNEAIGKSCLLLLDDNNNIPSKGLTHWLGEVVDPSMLDWVGHLLHNKRNRQARDEIRRAFQVRAVERAVRLTDNRHGKGSGRRGEASPLMAARAGSHRNGVAKTSMSTSA